MSSTAFRIELLTIGLQVMIGLAILFPSEIWGFVQPLLEGEEDQLAALGKLFIPGTLIFLAFAYSAGSLVDGLTAWIEDQLEKKGRLKVEGEGENNDGRKASSEVMRLKFPDAYKEFIASDYELRLLRSTTFNLLLFTFGAFCTGLNEVGGWATALTFFCFVAWGRRRQKAAKRRQRVFQTADAIYKTESRAKKKAAKRG